MASVVFSEGGMKNFVVLPAAVADRHLRACTGEALKTLIYLLRNEDRALDIALIANDLDISEAAVTAGIEYWVKCGLLCKRGDALSFSPASDSRTLPRFSPETVSMRAQGDKTLARLLVDIEQLMARPLTFEEQSGIYGMYDWMGLPAPVVALLAEYCINSGKGTMRYMQRMAESWAGNGIVTASAAAAEVERLRAARTVEGRVMSLLGISGRALTDREKLLIAKWTGELGYGEEEIKYAFEEAVEHSGKLSFAYMDKVLESAHEKGRRTAGEMREAPRPARTSGKGKKNNSEASFDREDLFHPVWDVEQPE